MSFVHNLPDGVTLADIDERFGDDPTLETCDHCENEFSEDELHDCDGESLCDECSSYCEGCWERFSLKVLTETGGSCVLMCPQCHADNVEEDSG